MSVSIKYCNPAIANPNLKAKNIIIHFFPIPPRYVQKEPKNPPEKLKSEEFSLKCKKTDCKSYALKSDDFCFFHSQKPEIVEKRKLSQSLGGSKSKIHKEPISIESLTDIQEILLEALNEIRCSDAGNIVSKSRATAYICLILANMKERIELEKRVEALEIQINNSYLSNPL
jgi:hypothetical protein